MDLLETNSSRQSIQKYIDNNIPLYLVIQKGIDVVCKLIVVKCIEINEIDNNIWWMEYIEKYNRELSIIHNWNSEYCLFETEEETLNYMTSSLKSIMINADRKICTLVDRLKYVSTSKGR